MSDDKHPSIEGSALFNLGFAEAQSSPAKNVAPEEPPAAPAAGRAAFKGINRGLTSEELNSPGTTKLLLDMLDTAERERDESKDFVTRYYDAERRACIAEEKLQTSRTLDVVLAFGIGIGGVIAGLGPIMIAVESVSGSGVMVLGVGLMVGSAYMRLRK